MKHGFIKVAAAAPEIRVADPMFNADAVIRAMDEHARLGVKVLVFPELTLTGATCGDLFYQNTLLAGAAAALEKVVKASEGKDMLVFVGLPVAQGAKVYDAAAAVCNGELLGVVPASCPGDKHFALPGALLDDIQIGSSARTCPPRCPRPCATRSPVRPCSSRWRASRWRRTPPAA